MLLLVLPCHRLLCCAACGHAVLDAAAALGARRDAPSLDLPDCDSYAVGAAALLRASWGRPGSPRAGGASGASPGGIADSGPGAPPSGAPGAVLGPEAQLNATPVLLCLRATLGLRRAGDPGCEVRAREVLCGGCGLHLGLSLTRLGHLHAGATAACIRCELPAPGCGFAVCLHGWRWPSPACAGEHCCMQRLAPGCSCPVKARSARAWRCLQPAPRRAARRPRSNWRQLQLLGVCFLGRRYLRLRRPDGQEECLGRPANPASLALYRCTAARSQLRQPGQCGAMLFTARDVLSR